MDTHNATLRNTLITAFFRQRDGHTTRPIDTYFKQFNRLAQLGLPIICYIDKDLELPHYDNVTTIKVSVDEFEIARIMNSCTQVAVADNPRKNTLDFHRIMSCKTEFCDLALKDFHLERATWVDFGIGHVIKNDDSLKELMTVDKLQEGIIIPGCWDFRTYHIDNVSWRFCGGFFTADRDHLVEFHQKTVKMIRETVPFATWEVNTWARVESIYGLKFKWYKADHNDSIFGFKSLSQG